MLLKLKNLLFYIFLNTVICQPCSAPINLVRTPVKGYCAIDTPQLLNYGETEMNQLTTLMKFTITLWFRPDLKSPGRAEQGLFRVSGDPSDTTASTEEGVRLGLFFTADANQNTNIRLQYSKSSFNQQNFVQQFQYVEQKWVFVVAGLDYISGLVSYYAWQPFSPTLRLNPQPIQESPGFHTQLPPTSVLQLLYWGDSFRRFCGYIDDVRWYPNYIEKGYLHNWLNIAFFDDGYTFEMRGFFKLEDGREQLIRDSIGLNANGVLGSTDAVEAYDPSFTDSEMLFLSGQYATLPAPQVASINLAYGVSLWFRIDAIINADGDGGDLTKDLVLLKRYQGESTEVFGLMADQGSGNLLTTKLKLHGVIQNLPALTHVKNVWHFISIRIAYPNAVTELSKIIFDVVMENGVNVPHTVTTLSNQYIESIQDTIVLGDRRNGFTGFMWLRHIRFFNAYTLYTDEALQCQSDCQISVNTPSYRQCHLCINGKYEDQNVCVNACTDGSTALTNSDIMSCRNCDFKCSHCHPDGLCYGCNQGYYLVSAGDSCVVSGECDSGMVGDPGQLKCTNCGNGALDADTLEECDDGNFVTDDGCSSCVTDAGFVCNRTGLEPDVCVPRCGDGTIQAPEACDDGNTIINDGCSLCLVDAGWECAGRLCNKKCGNQALDAGEVCDDGNEDDYDGCSSACQVESGYECNSLTPNVCSLLCGNERVDVGEECDDGNRQSNDGCTDCVVDRGWSCNTGTSCQQVCGNGVRDAAEECDDGNQVSQDGCTKCVVDGDYICGGGSSSSQDQCSLIPDVCGDGIRKSSEQCDDGNTSIGDGCSFACLIEIGWYCDGGSQVSKDICLTVCGDGLHIGYEECDDGNIFGGDGCNESCMVEPLYTCNPKCTYTCGNGLQDAFEQCDDGNTQDDDGCSSVCRVENNWKCWEKDGSSQAVCFKCTIGCATCKETCLSCQSGMFLADSGACEVGCRRGYRSNIGKGICDPCPKGCLECNEKVCLLCDNDKFLVEGGCFTTCPDGYHNHKDPLQGNSCIKCTAPCGICTSADECTQCGDTFYMNKEGVCSMCNMGEKCLRCEFDQNICTMCSSNFYRYENTCLPIPQICGDGLHHQLETCDDGNLDDGDGCSEQCRLENEWNCILEDSQGPDICYELSPPRITSTTSDAQFDRLFLHFSRPLKSNTTNFTEITVVSITSLDDYKLKLLQSPDENGTVYVYNSVFIPYDYTIQQVSYTTLEVRFNFRLSVVALNATINFTRPNLVVDKYNWTLVGDEAVLSSNRLLQEPPANTSSINPFYKSYVSVEAQIPYYIDYEASEVMIVQGITLGVSLLILIGLLSSCAYALFIGEGRNFKLLEFLQIISALRFVQWRYAYNLDLLLNMMYYSNGTFILNMFSSSIKENDQINFADPTKFQIFKYSGQYLVSGGGRFISWVIYISLVYLIINIAHRFIKNPMILNYIDQIRNYFLLIRLIEVIYLDLMISTMLQIKNPQVVEQAQSMSVVLCFLILTIMIALHIVILKKCILNAQLTRVQSFYGKFGALFDSINFDTSIYKFYCLVPYIQKMLIAWILVFIIIPTQQVFGIIVIRLIPLVVTRYHPPYIIEQINKRENYYEGGIIMVCLSTGTFSNYYDEPAIKMLCGWVTITLIVVMVCGQIYWLRYALKVVEQVTPMEITDHKRVEENNDDENGKVNQAEKQDYIQKVRQMEEDFFGTVG